MLIFLFVITKREPMPNLPCCHHDHDDVSDADASPAKPGELHVDKIRYWLVPAGDDGQPVMTRSIPIHAMDDMMQYLSPVEPYYTIEAVAAMLCMSRNALQNYLQRNKQDHPPLYRRTALGHGNVRVRLIPALEVRKIADRLIKRKLTRKPPTRNRDGSHGNDSASDIDVDSSSPDRDVHASSE